MSGSTLGHQPSLAYTKLWWLSTANAARKLSQSLLGVELAPSIPKLSLSGGITCLGCPLIARPASCGTERRLPLRCKKAWSRGRGARARARGSGALGDPDDYYSAEFDDDDYDIPDLDVPSASLARGGFVSSNGAAQGVQVAAPTRRCADGTARRLLQRGLLVSMFGS